MKIVLLMLALTSSCTAPTNESGQRVLNYKPNEITCINGIQYYRYSGSIGHMALVINKKTLTFVICDMEKVDEQDALEKEEK